MINPLVDRFPAWLEESGPYSEMILFSKVSLYRNLGGYKFNKKTTDKEKEQILSLLFEGISTLSDFENYITLKDLEDRDKRFFLERHFISRKEYKNSDYIGLALNDFQNNMLVLNSATNPNSPCCSHATISKSNSRLVIANTLTLKTGIGNLVLPYPTA